MSFLKLFLFGPPRIERDGHAIKIRRRKALALLSYLAVSDEPHSRDALATLFWTNLDQTKARANLRRELSTLTKSLGKDQLAIDREQVSLNKQSTLWLDVVQFQQHLAECQTHGHAEDALCPDCFPLLTDAVNLYSNDFLAGFTLSDSSDFDEWQFFQTESLRQALAGVLERLVHGQCEQGVFAAAIPYARRWVGLDPLNELAQRQLMQLYSWTGQRAAALRQYEESAHVLNDALGTTPEIATTKLYESIKIKRLSPPLAKPDWGQLDRLTLLTSPVSGDTPPSYSAPPFVARERELARLNAHLEAVLSGQGKIAFVIGEAGSGKTALVNEFARRAQQTHPDLIVAGGVCDVFTGISDPYLPFREVLRLLSGDVESGLSAGTLSRDQALRLWRLLPQTVQALLDHGQNLINSFIDGTALETRAASFASNGVEGLTELRALRARQAKPGSQSLQQDRVFETYTTVLKTLAAQQPLLLMLDDVHWADLSSISLIAHLARRLEDSPILLISIYRPEDVAQGRQGQAHPLNGLLSECKRYFGEVWVDLDRAGRTQARRFVDAWIDASPNWLNETFRQRLAEHTEGHPLFVVELLREMQARGELRQDEDRYWIEGSNLSWNTLPARVEGVIEKRIDRLTPELRQALTIASVEGEIFTAEVVAQIQGIEARELVRCLSGEVDQQHRLVVAQGRQRIGPQRLSFYRFRHNLFRTYLYNSIDAVEISYQHEAVGNALESLYGDQTEGISAQLAQHFQDAEMLEKAIGYLYRAGERARHLSAYAEAIGYLNRALTLLEQLPDSAKRRRQELDFQLALGPVLRVAEGYASPKIIQTYIRAQELAQQLANPEQRFSALWGLFSTHLGRSDLAQAHELATQCLVIANEREDSNLRMAAHRALGMTLLLLGKLNLAQTHLQRVIELYDVEYHHYQVKNYGIDNGLMGLSNLAWVLKLQGYPDQALQRSQEAVQLAQALGYAFTTVTVLMYDVILHEFRGETEAARKGAENVIALATKENLALNPAAATVIRGSALVRQGETQTGLAQLKKGLADREVLTSDLDKPRYLSRLAEAYLLTGQPEVGLEIVAEALAQVETTGEIYWAAELHRLRGEHLLLQDEPEQEAEICFEQAITIAQQQQAKSLELRATLSLSRLWQKQGKIEEAQQILADVYNWFSEGFDTADLQAAKSLLDDLGHSTT